MFSVHIYIDLQIFINKFQLKEIFFNHFVKSMILQQATPCYKCIQKNYCIIIPQPNDRLRCEPHLIPHFDY